MESSQMRCGSGCCASSGRGKVSVRENRVAMNALLRKHPINLIPCVHRFAIMVWQATALQVRGLGVRKLACALFRGSLLPRPPNHRLQPLVHCKYEIGAVEAAQRLVFCCAIWSL